MGKWAGGNTGVLLGCRKQLFIAISRIRAPVLIIAGSQDHHTTMANSRRLYANAPAAKQFWPIHHAGHIDLYDSAPAQYERTILAFLEQHLETSQ